MSGQSYNPPADPGEPVRCRHFRPPVSPLVAAPTDHHSARGRIKPSSHPSATRKRRQVKPSWRGHYVVSDRAAEAALRAVEANAELFRQYKGFADPVPTAADAPILDRLLALSGRNPAWTPSAD
jgi:hypothetical protein